jgi:hypothetical protein
MNQRWLASKSAPNKRRPLSKHQLSAGKGHTPKKGKRVKTNDERRIKSHTHPAFRSKTSKNRFRLQGGGFRLHGSQTPQKGRLFLKMLTVTGFEQISFRPVFAYTKT